LSCEGRRETGRVLIEIMSQARYGLLILDCAQQFPPVWHSRQSAKIRPEQFQFILFLVV